VDFQAQYYALMLISVAEEVEEGCYFALILKHERRWCSAWGEGERAREKMKLKSILGFLRPLLIADLIERPSLKSNKWSLKEFGLHMQRLPTLSSTTGCCIQSAMHLRD